MASAFCTYQAVRHGPADSGCGTHPYIAAFVSLTIVINGQYYMQRVTANWGVKGGHPS